MICILYINGEPCNAFRSHLDMTLWIQDNKLNHIKYDYKIIDTLPWKLTDKMRKDLLKFAKTK